MNPQLCLGTVQFGLDYGVTNVNGQISQYEINNIIKRAQEEEVKFIDTAQGYGDSEKRLGTTNLMKNNFNIISKFSNNKTTDFNKEDTKKWEEDFQLSLNNLKVNKIDSFLIHNLKDLKGSNAQSLMYWLDSLKNRDLVKKIGLSIYDPKDIQNIYIDKFDLIQLPLSIYDQRFLKSGIIEELKQKNKSIHVRSVFLQGLILQKYNKLPIFLSHGFKEHHKYISFELKKRNIKMMQAALFFIYARKNIDALLFGVSSIKEFEQIIKTWKSLQSNKIDIERLDFSWDNTEDLDPRLWKLV